jgi:hypothetical protein
MYIRTATKSHPALAADIQETLDIITYILNIINTIYNLFMNILGNMA